MFYNEMHQILYIHQELDHIQNCLLEGHRFPISPATNPNECTTLWCLWHILLSYLVLPFEVRLGLWK